ncbi:MAG: RNA-binding cell elongation regulator Jag/EloR [Chloroflexota bacterium]
MNERTTLEIIAPTVDEAVAKGLADLGLTAEMVAVEVLDEGTRGFLGLGGRQVRVRLTVKGSQVGPETGQPVQEPVPAEGIPTEDHLLGVARQTAVDLLDRMRVDAYVEVSYGDPDEKGERPVQIDIHGDDLGILIGRRAEILNALQYIINLIVSKQVEHWAQIVVDVEGYRVRRERQLRQMARRMADQALKTGRRQVLEPMAANDRRIIHLELRQYTGVVTESVGEGPARKVTILPK